MQKLKDCFWGVVLRIYIFVLRIFGKFPSKRELEEWQKEQDKENEPYVKAAIREEVKLAKAFKSLILGLPHRLRDLRTYFSDFPKVDEEFKKYFYAENEEEVKLAGSPYSEMLIEHGLKINNLLWGIYAVEALIMRGLRRNLVNENDLVIDLPSKSFCNPILQEGMTKEIEMVMRLDSKGTGQYGKIIFSWIVEVLQNKPLLFERFKAVYDKEKIQLVVEDINQEPYSLEKLDARWKVTRYSETQLDLSIGEDGPDA